MQVDAGIERPEFRNAYKRGLVERCVVIRQRKSMFPAIELMIDLRSEKCLQAFAVIVHHMLAARQQQAAGPQDAGVFRQHAGEIGCVMQTLPDIDNIKAGSLERQVLAIGIDDIRVEPGSCEDAGNGAAAHRRGRIRLYRRDGKPGLGKGMRRDAVSAGNIQDILRTGLVRPQEPQRLGEFGAGEKTAAVIRQVRAQVRVKNQVAMGGIAPQHLDGLLPTIREDTVAGGIHQRASTRLTMRAGFPATMV
jgi:hypothetical protein